MKFQKISIILIVSCLFMACGPSQLFRPTATPTAMSTSTPVPTATSAPTATPEPIKSINLEKILNNSADMPRNCSAGETSSNPPWVAEYLAKFPEQEHSIYQPIICSGDDVGGVTIFLYQDTADISKAYKELEKETVIEDVGEQASAEADCGYVVSPGKSAGYACWVKLAFTRCSAVVNISLSNIEDAKSGGQFAYTYARQLDEALSAQVCIPE